MSRSRTRSFDAYSTLFGVAYLCLVTNVLLVATSAPLLTLLITTDPARSWPLVAAAVPVAAPAVAAAFTVFAGHAAGGPDVARTFFAGWRRCWRKAAVLAAVHTGVLVVVLVDIRALAGSPVGVVFIPALGVTAVVTVATGVLGLVAITEVPGARLRDVVRVGGYLAVRRWLLILAALAVLATQVALFASVPAVALGITGAPALYVAWANCRHILAPALAATAGGAPPSTHSTAPPGSGEIRSRNPGRNLSRRRRWTDLPQTSAAATPSTPIPSEEPPR